MVGFDMSKAAAEAVYKEAGVTAKDVQVIELHGNATMGITFNKKDCFSCNELLTYEALGLCKEGDGGKLIDNGNALWEM
jgi:acetyl-CoA acyltransferase